MAVLGPGSYMSVGGVGEHQGPKEPREPQGGTQGSHREGPKEPGRGTAQGKPREPKGATGRACGQLGFHPIIKYSLIIMNYY